MSGENRAMLVLNAGSSSIKFELYTVVDEDRIITDEDLEQRFEGQVEGIGTAPRLIARDPDGHILIDERWAPGPPGTNHQVALKRLTTWIDDNLGDAQLIGVGHRVVHGGPVYSTPVVITPEVLEVLRTYISLAPLHQPHSLAAIEAILYTRPDLLQVACFDTAFHRNHPIVADQYAIPREYYEQGVRRYGFHGLSYAYIAHVLPIVAPDLSEGRVVVAHRGERGQYVCNEGPPEHR